MSEGEPSEPGELPPSVLKSNNLPSGWTWVKAECIGGKPPNWTHIKYEGAVYERITRGKRKGQRNYRKPVPGTDATVVLEIQRVEEEPLS